VNDTRDEIDTRDMLRHRESGPVLRHDPRPFREAVPSDDLLRSDDLVPDDDRLRPDDVASADSPGAAEDSDSTPDIHPDRHDDCAAYTLGVLDPVARSIFEAHLERCEPCRAEHAAQRRAIGLLPYGLPPEHPPAGARDRLLVRACAEAAGTVSAAPAMVDFGLIEGTPDATDEAIPAAAIAVAPAFADEVLLIDAAPGVAEAIPAAVEATPDATEATPPTDEAASAATADVPPVEAVLDADDKVASLAAEDIPAVSDETVSIGAAPTAQGMPASHEADSAVTDEVVLAAAEPVADATAEVVPADAQKAVLTDAAAVEGVAEDTDDDGEDEEDDEPSATVQRPDHRPAEIPTAEALAAALAPIPSRRVRPQRPRREPGSFKIRPATVGWAISLLFVIVTGLLVTVWSATGPHISPDVGLRARLPGGQVLPLRGTGVPSAGGHLYLIEGGRRAELSVTGLPPPPEGRIYQAWILESRQEPRSGGSFLVTRRGEAVVRLTVALAIERLQSIYITQEPLPASSTPTGVRLLEWSP
jgi:hypothetical protein